MTTGSISSDRAIEPFQAVNPPPTCASTSTM
jgi:hypothetical protein